MRPLTSIILLLLIGCVSTDIQQHRPVTAGQIYVSQFTGSAGPIVSNAIQIEFQKQNLLATRDQAKFILTGYADFPGWTDGIAFELKSKKGVLYLRGNATSGGFLVPAIAGKDLAKKIIKKLQENQKKILDKLKVSG